MLMIILARASLPPRHYVLAHALHRQIVELASLRLPTQPSSWYILV